MYYTQINNQQRPQNDNTTFILFEEVTALSPPIYQHEINNSSISHEPINQHKRYAALDTIHGNISSVCIKSSRIAPSASIHQFIDHISNHIIHQNNNQCLFDCEAIKLLQEIYNNLGWKINLQKMYQTIYNKKHDPRHTFIVKHNLGLNNSEFIAIVLWTSSERLTKKYHIDCGNNNEYKWKLFEAAMTNGVQNICKAVIINESSDDSVNIFYASLPSVLYRGTTYFKPNCDKWNLDTILSLTSSLSVAQSFAARNVDAEGHTSYILCVHNFAKHILNGKLMAAPIDWLSSYDYEQEWIVLPSVMFEVLESNEVTNVGGRVYELLIM